MQITVFLQSGNDHAGFSVVQEMKKFVRLSFLLHIADWTIFLALFSSFIIFSFPPCSLLLLLNSVFFISLWFYLSLAFAKLFFSIL